MRDFIHNVDDEYRFKHDRAPQHHSTCRSEAASARKINSLHADRLRAKLLRPEMAGLYEDLKKYGERALNEPLPSLCFHTYRQYAITGERKAYEDVYFERRGRLAAVALLALEPTDSKMMHTLENLLWAVCEEYTWCLPAHLGTGEAEQVEGNIDLFAAETVHMLAEIATIHHDRLDHLILERIRNEAERRIFTPLYRKQRTFEWQTADHNWSAVCGGGCGMAALLLLGGEQDEEIVHRSVEQTVRSMKAFLSGYGEDGGCAEGIGYWVYGFGYYTYYAEMFHEYSQGELDLLSGSHVAAIAAFPLRVHLSGGTFVNYSDSSEQEDIPSGLLSLLASRMEMRVNLPLDIPLFTDDPCHRWAHLSRNVMWSDLTLLRDAGAAAAADRGFIFHNLGWMVAKGTLEGADERHSVGGSVQVACSIKGGHNDEPHNHNDLGQLLIHGGGENIICDPGAGLYTQAYFAPGREGLFHISSAGHSVPLIEGREQSSGRQAQSTVLKAEMSESGDMLDVVLDLTAAYAEAESLACYTRQMCWRVESDEADRNAEKGRGAEKDQGTERDQDADIDGHQGNSTDRNRAGKRAVMCVTDRFEWKQNGEVQSSTGQHGTEASRAGSPRVVERWMSQIQPVLVEEGSLCWQGAQAVLRMTYDAHQWQAFVETIDTVDHDNVPVTFYRTFLAWKGAENQHSTGTDHLEAMLLETVCEVNFVIESNRDENGVSMGE